MLIAHKLEAALGQVLDKQTLSVFVDEVVSIISSNIENPELLQKIGSQISVAMQRAVDSAGILATTSEAKNKQ